MKETTMRTQSKMRRMAVMTDRELLELAAKAAGYRPVEHISALRLTLDPPVTSLWLHDGPTAWNPLENGGDALRLAVKLGISLTQYPIHGEGVQHSVIAKQRRRSDTMRVVNPTETIEIYGSDPYAATRRAIVLCAAKIGEEMQ